MSGNVVDVDVGTNLCLRLDHSDFFVASSLSFGDCLNSVSAGRPSLTEHIQSLAQMQNPPRSQNVPVMRVFVAYFSQMGSSGCAEDPTFLLAALQKQIRSWNIKVEVETKCYQAPGRWMDYLSNADEEIRIGTDVYAALGSTAFNPWHELQEKYDDGEWVFLFVGASNGCVPASFFASQFAGKTLSLTLLSCVPGKEQWGSVARLRCPVTVTAGSAEKHFGGVFTIYAFAQTVHATVFAFGGPHLYEGKETLKRLACYVADASRPIEAAAPSSPRRSPRRTSKSPSVAKKGTGTKTKAQSASSPRRSGDGKSPTAHRRRRSNSGSADSRRSG